MTPTDRVFPSRKDRELPGIVRMIDYRRFLGKIFLDDGRESSVIRFPETYQDGDRIFATFNNNNPEEKILSFRVANDEWYYGTVIKLSDKGYGFIAINWPTLLEPVYFSTRQLKANMFMAVRFHLHKDWSGKLSVSELQEAQNEKMFFAKQPLCGSLERGALIWTSGFVKKVVNGEKGWFGFIEQPGTVENVYFTGRLFEKAYGRKAMNGDIVYFKFTRWEQGPAVSVFNPSGDDENNSAWAMKTHDFQGRRRTIRCPENTFSNFLEPSPEKLYFVYATREDVAAETREVRIERIPEAIALINNRNIPDEMKLAAVDFLIDADLEHPAKFRAPLMKERKIEMLEQATSSLLLNGRAEEALEHEIRLQCIEYRPERFGAYRRLSSPLPLLDMTEYSLPLEEENVWEIMKTDLLQSPEEQGEDAWRPIFEAPSDAAPRTEPDAFYLDLDWKSCTEILPAEDPLYFDIELT